MSIPVRFDVLGPGDQIVRNETFGTISYGIDVNDRNVCLEYLRRNIKDIPEKWKWRHPWIELDFEGFHMNGNYFLREEILDYKFDESVIRKNEFKDGPVILDDPKEEEKRVKAVNKKNYTRLKNDPMSGARDTDKWVDPE